MFRWLERWRERVAERRIQRLLLEVKAYRAQWREDHGDEPFPLTPDQRLELRRLRDQLSPEARQMIGHDDFFGLDDDLPRNPP